VAYNFQIGNNKIKLLAKYKNVTEKVLLSVESIQLWQIKLSEITLTFHKHFYFVVPCLKIIGHGKPDSNLESHCVCVCKQNKYTEKEERWEKSKLGFDKQ
jgi:hypothetical protein